MGYRSDVGLCLSAKGKLALDTALAEAEKSNPSCTVINNFMGCAQLHTDEKSGDVDYYWNYVKW